MTSACDDRSPQGGGGEKEEPNEPPPPQDCYVKVYGGYLRLREWLDSLKSVIYEYNEKIKGSGYYLKPVHKVYYSPSGGPTRVYEYYGRYWWRVEERGGRRRLVYAGRVKPRGLPDPPNLGVIEGLRVIVEGNDVIIECRVYEKAKSVFSGLKVEVVDHYGRAE
jgi:hypothetical protein